MLKKIKLIICSAVIVISLSACTDYDNMPEYVQSNSSVIGFCPIMESEKGCYYNNIADNIHMSLHYYDKATKTTVYLCNKPECNHDGNKYCEATNNSVKPMYSAMYNNQIYLVGLTSGEQKELKLYKANSDGTALTEISTFLKYKGNVSFSFDHLTSDMVIHKGKAYVPYMIGEGDSQSPNIQGLYEIDLSNGKSKKIKEINTLKDNFSQGPYMIKAQGNYVYYCMRQFGTESTMYRYSIKNGKTEEILKDIVISNYCIVNNKILYASTNDTDLKTELNMFDADKKETTAFEIKDSNNQMINLTDAKIMYDGTYLYIANGSSSNFFKAIKSQEFTPENIKICSVEGKCLATFSYDTKDEFQMNVINGKVYFQTYKKVEFCPIQDIINRNVQWKTEYKFGE